MSIRIREQDKALVESIFPIACTKYRDATGKEINLKVDEENNLAADNTGGIQLYAQKGKIKINNTLEARLDLIAQQLVPEIRNALFGRNVNRKFTD